MDATARFKLYAGSLAAQVCFLEAEVERVGAEIERKDAEIERLRALVPPEDGEAPSPEGATVPV